ncbi:MAG: hypothetical protein WA708_06860 [Acidobacteriaceae bacterium]
MSSASAAIIHNKAILLPLNLKGTAAKINSVPTTESNANAVCRRRVTGSWPKTNSSAPIAVTAQNASSGWMDWNFMTASSIMVLTSAATVEIDSWRDESILRTT